MLRLQEPLARGHPGPEPKLARELELARSRAQRVAVGVAKMPARQAHLVLDAGDAMGDFVPRCCRCQLCQSEMTARMGANRHQRICRQAAYFLPTHGYVGAEPAWVEARGLTKLGNDGAGIVFPDAAQPPVDGMKSGVLFGRTAAAPVSF